MTGMKRTTQKNLMLFSGRAHPELAEEVARLLGTELVPTTHREFANSEIYVRYQESVRGSDAFLIQSHTAPVNEWIMEQLIRPWSCGPGRSGRSAGRTGWDTSRP